MRSRAKRGKDKENFDPYFSLFGVSKIDVLFIGVIYESSTHFNRLVFFSWKYFSEDSGIWFFPSLLFSWAAQKIPPQEIGSIWENGHPD